MIDTERLDRIEVQLIDGHVRMDTMQAELTRNTEITNEVRELLDAAKAGLRVIGGIGTATLWLVRTGGKIAAAGVAIWGAIYTLTHHGQLPPKP